MDAHALATRDYLEALLRTGLMLVDILSELVEELPPGAFAGEHTPEVLLEMVTGSLLPVTGAAGPAAVQEAIALLEATGDRVLGDLRQAVELARARDARGA